ncbi:hypothetical protein COO60DRAFT_1645802 [Scenedesmus sp. NREL 46B-D3]|nr:hypothetical protein COO60DRAFT_1645802 [Scenedesmus sp. NREL 46B-D3]
MLLVLAMLQPCEPSGSGALGSRVLKAEGQPQAAGSVRRCCEVQVLQQLQQQEAKQALLMMYNAVHACVEDRIVEQEEVQQAPALA